ncbi:hypothetical protein IE53DRAFT_383001 [Violaceomyces palustris]|uniref:Uncharacterized protein n=1 Tax=Violaceomyces palustris TaxID=1673888 RepID=A0ACD0P8C4_9BASI|nr:hypothetical protein IE53DRAFT_383001 [Violaceomyces palustris]
MSKNTLQRLAHLQGRRRCFRRGQILKKDGSTRQGVGHRHMNADQGPGFRPFSSARKGSPLRTCFPTAATALILFLGRDTKGRIRGVGFSSSS